MPKELTKEETAKLYKRGFEDPVWWLRTFFPDWFPTEVPWFHRGIVAILTRRADFLPAYGELEKIETNFTYPQRPGDPKSPQLPVFDFSDPLKPVMHTLVAYALSNKFAPNTPPMTVDEFREVFVMD